MEIKLVSIAEKKVKKQFNINPNSHKLETLYWTGHLSRDCPEPRRDRGGRDYNNRDSNRDSRGSRDSRDSRDSGSRDNRNSGSSSSSSNRTYNNSNNNNNNNNRQTTWETSTFKSGWDSPQQEQ